MINANELRIGNWVKKHSSDKPTCISGITNVDIRFSNGTASFVNYIDPVLITSEILEKAGFDIGRSNDMYDRIIYSIQIANNTALYFDAHKDWMRDDNYVEWYLSYEWNNNHFKNDFWNKPQYLHQLQNLYFALTGSELIINL